MKHALLITVLLFSFKSFAQSCGSLSEGETIRLDDNNKSLQNFKVQDQDGLGSCYANAASLLLQGSLVGNPELSYIHLATLYKAEQLTEKRASAKEGVDFNIYAKQVKDNNKAISGGGEAMNWELALDGGHTCGVITKIKELEAKAKKPIVCKKSEMNFEKILSSGDNEHKQFKTMLQSSVYMNQFQKTFGDLAEKPTWFTKKRILKAQEKYQAFKNNFEGLLATKKQNLELACKKVNTDHLEPIVEPMTQLALAYQDCFKLDSQNRNAHTCKAVRAITGEAKLKGDGSYEVGITSKEWIKSFQAKIQQRKAKFNVENLSNDLADSLIESLGIDKKESRHVTLFVKENLIAQTRVNKNLENLSAEFNEVNEKGFSPVCVTRNTYNYFETKEYENDWKNNEGLCSYAELMKQAGSVVVRYKESGLTDLKTVMDFLTIKAGDTYDTAMMALYASDCDDKGKFSIPQSIQCSTMPATFAEKDKINEKIIEKLKSNKPLTASLCAQILKKPKSKFAEKECGNHALGITGVQCSGGKLKYMIQNSWGANNKAGADSEGIENIDGKGAYWFNEQAFFDSVYSVDYLN